MIAASRKAPEQAPGDIEALLPWHATGTLDARDARRVEEALARDPALARQYAAIQDEYAETVALNENLGAPSIRAMQKLFAAIDAEPAQTSASPRRLSARVSQFFASLPPRTLAASATLGGLALLLQAGVIGAILVRGGETATFQTASYRAPNAPLTRGLEAADAGPVAIVRFAPDARVSDINALLDAYQATIVSASKGGLFRLRFGSKPTAARDFASLIGRLQSERIVNLAVPAK